MDSQGSAVAGNNFSGSAGSHLHLGTSVMEALNCKALLQVFPTLHTLMVQQAGHGQGFEVSWAKLGSLQYFSQQPEKRKPQTLESEALKRDSSPSLLGADRWAALAARLCD